MNKILFIIQREYISRVSKKSFWILSLLVPLLYFGIIAFSVVSQKKISEQLKKVYVIDRSGLIADSLKSNASIEFVIVDTSEEESVINEVRLGENIYLLKIPVFNVDNPGGFKLIAGKITSSYLVEGLREELKDRIRDLRVARMGLDAGIIQKLNPQIDMEISKITESGLEKDNTLFATIIAWIAAFLNYMFIFVYGSMVMRGVHEEKQNRIVEIMISAVRPFELMFGKIIGVAMAGLTQFFFWVLLILMITVGADTLPGMGGMEFHQVLNQFQAGMASLNISAVIALFVFYFISGYLLYSSLFAAIAAATDNQADLQQFMFPLTIPIIIAIMVNQIVIESPNSSIAIWLSMIPFTSPVSMMARITFGVPPIQLLASMFILVLTFILTTWIGAKIYRIGILLYGAKVSYKDLWKWLFYK